VDDFESVCQHCRPLNVQEVKDVKGDGALKLDSDELSLDMSRIPLREEHPVISESAVTVLSSSETASMYICELGEHLREERESATLSEISFGLGSTYRRHNDTVKK
jgi:hypothetical protein